MAQLTAANLGAFLAREFPQMSYLNIRIGDVRPRDLKVRAPRVDRHLRPSGTIAVGEVGICPDGRAEPVAHAVLTYALPANA